MRVKFYIETGFVSCVHEIEEEVPDDMTEKELDDYARELAWEYINVYHKRINEKGV